MSMHPKSIDPLPAETGSISQAVFPKGNGDLRLRDALGSLQTDEAFADLFPTDGQSPQARWRLVVITALECAEMLSHRT